MSDQPRSTSNPRSTIVVTGDVTADHHIYASGGVSGAAGAKAAVSQVRQHGGAANVHRLIEAMLAELAAQPAQKAPQSPPGAPTPTTSWKVLLSATPPRLDAPENAHHTFAVWTPSPSAKKDGKDVWRASLLLGHGHDGTVGARPDADASAPPPAAPPSRILVLDDEGFVFRDGSQRAAWNLPGKGADTPDWVVLKMSAPVAEGDLWREVKATASDRLICVVSAKELREEPVCLSRGLSWERTLQELSAAVHQNPVLQDLRACRHLIVVFSADGALWLDRDPSGKTQATLVCDAGGAEGEWARDIKNEAVGYLSCVIAAIVRELVEASSHDAADARSKPQLAHALAAGLGAMRDLRALGHGEVAAGPPHGYPAARLASAIVKPRDQFARIPLPWPLPLAPRDSRERPWMLVEASQGVLGAPTRPSLAGLARQIVLQGTSVLAKLPHARFGALVTADRLEIEALRNIRRLMLEYRDQQNASKPLSIGVFGPPGAGKSFGVKQLASAIFGKEAWLEFNLSQFSGSDDLDGAFHQVRDRVLSGVTPVVFWDEFDSRNYEWLQYLLAPMQDGRFQERQLTHAIGKCVFVFAGATSSSFEEFGPRQSDREAWEPFKLRKGPDFHSRLDAYYNVLGPNPRMLAAEAPERATATDGAGAKDAAPQAGQTSSEPRVDPADVCAPLRRALLIRALLKSGPAEHLDWDSDLVDALLHVSKYKHGARSLEKVVAGLRPAGGGPIRRSSLPPPNQLEMHVDLPHFNEILERNRGVRDAAIVEALAAVIHTNFRQHLHEKGQALRPHLDHDFADLAPADKEVNRAAARRIPEVLALAGLTICELSEGAPDGAPSGEEIAQHIEHHIERLAEAEHDGWRAQKERDGWIYGDPYDAERKRHPALVPYGELSRADKEKDRDSVRNYPKLLRSAGYGITLAG